ncbi:MAG TPA: hypothetical protein VFC67_16070 [Prolixibacteraceae bacterium]|nr:hypothetical protein [Prolixibacteraceae bacterium]
MEDNDESRGWIKTITIIGVVLTIVINVGSILYSTLIKNNDLKNDVKAMDSRISKVEVAVINIQDKKLDKETFNLILTTLTELRSDIRDLSNKK